MEVSTRPKYQDTDDDERNGLPSGSYFPAVRLATAARGLKWLSELPHVSRLFKLDPPMACNVQLAPFVAF